MFCYSPKDEMAVRSFVERLENEQLKCNVQIVDLYETFLSICEDMDILEGIPEMEQDEGKEFLEEQLTNTIDAKVFSENIKLLIKVPKNQACPTIAKLSTKQVNPSSNS